MVRARNVLGAIVRVIKEKLTLFWMVNIDIPRLPWWWFQLRVIKDGMTDCSDESDSLERMLNDKRKNEEG